VPPRRGSRHFRRPSLLAATVAPSETLRVELVLGSRRAGAGRVRGGTVAGPQAIRGAWTSWGSLMRFGDADAAVA
jgi:hypothetical protein